MVGNIGEVTCAKAPEVQFVLKAQMIVMHLHADDLGKIVFKSEGSSAPAKAPNCSALRGRTARVSYLFVTGKPWDAEIQTVELRSQP